MFPFRPKVAVQREWVGDPAHQVRIARYDTETAEWRFFYYPLDTPTSPNGGWVGLSEIVARNMETFLIVERDDQTGADARIKKMYEFSVSGLTPVGLIIIQKNEILVPCLSHVAPGGPG